MQKFAKLIFIISEGQKLADFKHFKKDACDEDEGALIERVFFPDIFFSLKSSLWMNFEEKNWLSLLGYFDFLRPSFPLEYSSFASDKLMLSFGNLSYKFSSDFLPIWKYD